MGFIISIILFVALGITNNFVAGTLSPEAILDNGGALYRAYVIEAYDPPEDIDADPYTLVCITDDSCPWDGYEVKVSQYHSSAAPGNYTEVYFDGNDLMLKDMTGTATVLSALAWICWAIAIIITMIALGRLLLFLFVLSKSR